MYKKRPEIGNIYRLFFKALYNQTRFEILQLLRKEPLTVTELCEKTGFEQSRISHNLKCLIDCGFVKNNRRGKNVIYSLNKETINPLLEIIDKHIVKYSAHLKKCGIIKR